MGVVKKEERQRLDFYTWMPFKEFESDFDGGGKTFVRKWLLCLDLAAMTGGPLPPTASENFRPKSPDCAPPRVPLKDPSRRDLTASYSTTSKQRSTGVANGRFSVMQMFGMTSSRYPRSGNVSKNGASSPRRIAWT